MDNKLRRKLIQIAAFGFTNSHLSNLGSGRLYTGSWKNFCAPGLNCYSCPAAAFSCPVGAMQAVLGDRKFNLSFYVTGLLLAFGVVLGRAVCGFLCPFGLFQELLYKLPRMRGEGRRHHLPKWLTYIKYVILAVFVIGLPLFAAENGTGSPAFCKYICPAGTLEGGIPAVITQPGIRAALGALFSWKLFVLIAVVALSLMYFRFFCRAICPLGAIYGLMNRVSIYRLTVDKHSCVNCGKCAQICRMEVDPVACPDSAECIRCGECAAACPAKAIKLGFKGAPSVNGISADTEGAAQTDI